MPVSLDSAKRSGMSKSTERGTLDLNQFMDSSASFCLLAGVRSVGTGRFARLARASAVGSSNSLEEGLLVLSQLTTSWVTCFCCFGGSDVCGIGIPVIFSSAKAVGSSISAGLTSFCRIQFKEFSTIFFRSFLSSWTRGIPARLARAVSWGSSRLWFGSFDRSQFMVSSMTSFLSSGAMYPLVVGI